MIPNLQARSLVPERMDDPTLPESDHLQALRGLRRINRWTGHAQLAWQPIRQLAATNGARPLTLLDIATGSGDVAQCLLRYASAQGTELELHACDISPTAIEFARHGFTADASINLFQLDVVSEPLPHQYDVVMCTTFLHHLSEADVLQTLRKMRAAARRRVVVVDLERSALNWWQVWLGCHLLSRSSVVHFDGPQSVRAAFTISEMREFAAEVGFKSIRLQRRWPCKFLFVGDV